MKKNSSNLNFNTFASILLFHWKSVVRNGQRSKIGFIIKSGLSLYFLFMFAFIGFSINELSTLFKSNPIEVYKSLLTWFFIVDLFVRTFFQSVLSFKIIPYLRLNIKRSTLVNFSLLFSLLSIYNVLPIVLFIPFYVDHFGEATGTIGTALFTTLIILLTALNNYFTVLFQSLFSKNAYYHLLPILFLFIIIESRFYLPIPSYYIPYINNDFLVNGDSIYLVTLVATLVILIRFIQITLSKLFYWEYISSSTNKSLLLKVQVSESIFSYNTIIQYIIVEILLLFRNKRSRQMLSMLPLSIGFFLIMILHETNPHKFIYLISLSIILSIGPALYGQYIFSWESSGMDGILCRKINLTNYIRAKYYLLLFLTIIVFVPCSIIFYFKSTVDVAFFTSLFLFSIGIISFIILYLATFNTKRMNPNENDILKYKGTSANQVVLSVLFVLLPCGLYAIIHYLFNDFVAKIGLSAVGIIFFVTHIWWIENIIVPAFMYRKYKNLQGFRFKS